MNNRIEKYFNKGECMKRQINDITSLTKALEESEGYALGITLFNKGILEHYLLTQSFPIVDLLKSIAKTKDLAVEELEKDNLPEF
jgi:hypothetical protein